MPRALRRHPASVLVAAVVATGLAGLGACTSGDDSRTPGTSTTTSVAEGRVARARRIPCPELAPPGPVGAALGRPVAPSGGTAPAGTCVLAVEGTTDEFVVVAVSGPARRDALYRQAPQATPVDGLGDVAVWDTAIPVGGRLLVLRRGVEVGVVLQVRDPEGDTLRAAGEAIAQAVLARIPG